MQPRYMVAAKKTYPTLVKAGELKDGVTSDPEQHPTNSKKPLDVSKGLVKPGSYVLRSGHIFLCSSAVGMSMLIDAQ